MRRLCTVALASAVVATTVVVAGQATYAEPRPEQQPLYGFHQDVDYFGGSSPERIDAIASIGAQVSRSTLLWRNHEPSDGEYDWSSSDIVQETLDAAGIQNLWYIGASPSWANGGGGDWDVPTYPSAEFDEWRDQAAEFAAAAAERYPGQMWEVWNEPNEIHFWKPTPNREAYSDLYRTVRSAILDADPSAKVAVGGITGLNASCVNDGCIRGADFIDEMLANGDPIDYLGIHAYTEGQGPTECDADGNRSFQDIALIQRILDEHGSDAELWLTEWGWTSDEVGEDGQAEYLTQAHEMLASGSMELCPVNGGGQVEPNVTVSNWFFDIDTDDFTGWGVFRSDFSRKPAADAFEEFVGGTN